MSKLNPPIIEGTIPAFTSADGIKIPIFDNQSVNPSGKSYTVRIKTLITEKVLGDYSGTREGDYLKLNTPNNLIGNGEYFKFQVAYIDNNETGYYSNVGIGKYLTQAPTVTLTEAISKDGYVGKYESNKEKPYSYCFTIKNPDGTIYETSGELLHNFNTEDNNNEYIDSYKQQKELEYGVTYSIEYSVTTVNGFKKSAPIIYITKERTIAPILKNGHLIATNNYEEGYIDLVYNNPDLSLISGNFTIVRSSSKDDFKEWRLIYNFALSAENIHNRHLYKDFTVEQGIEYCYAIQQKNNAKIYSDKLKNDNNVIADFEDMFLFDGEKQLKIKFNPKVSSFKKTLMENKSDTIGSKYPFFFRNGRVEYKEFVINGLISYLMDENDLFTYIEEKPNKGTDGLINKQNTDLTSSNFLYERDFKLKVLDWLTDGKPKLFRSAAEGNYLVRLMNVSLTPNDTLGRMLHSFSATAYEIGDISYDSLVANNIIPDVHLMETANEDMGKTIFFHTIKLWENTSYSKDNNGNYTIQLKNNEIQNVKLMDMDPLTQVKIDDNTFIIGVSRSLTLPSNQKVNKIVITNGPTNGLLYYSYLGNLYNEFEEIVDTSVEYIIDRQFRGEHNQIIPKIETENITAADVAQTIENVKTDLTQIFRIQAQIQDYIIPETANQNMLNKIKIKYDKNDSSKDVIIDISNIGNYIAYNLENVYDIAIGANILLDITYAIAIKNFAFEKDISKKELEDAKTDFIASQTKENATAYNTAYNNYIVAVQNELKRKENEILIK